MSEVKYPNLHVRLVGADGNAFAVLGAVSRALKEAGVPPKARAEFMEEATSGDYDHLLATCMKWVVVS